MPDASRRMKPPPVHRLMGVQVVGTGSFLPDNVVTNEDLSRLGCDAEWIIQRTGIRERRHAPPEMGTGDLAIGAARAAMEAAGVTAADVDLLILGTFTPDHPIPQTATTVQDRLGLNCGAMDLSAACAGFMYSMITGAQFIATGAARRVLVVGADTNSRVLDPDDKKIFPLFGDGAGAVVLAPGADDQGFLAATLGADGSGTELLIRRAGGVLLPITPDLIAGDETPWLVEMQGRPIFKWAVRLLEDVYSQLLKAADRELDEVALWIMHQANQRILDAACDNVGIDHARVVKHLDRYGNTSAGSIPIALDETYREGRIARGDEIMLCGFGAGLSWGGALFKW